MLRNAIDEIVADMRDWAWIPATLLILGLGSIAMLAGSNWIREQLIAGRHARCMRRPTEIHMGNLQPLALLARPKSQPGALRGFAALPTEIASRFSRTQLQPHAELSQQDADRRIYGGSQCLMKKLIEMQSGYF